MSAAESRLSVNRFMRASERTRASSSRVSIGLVRKSSAPASRPSIRAARSAIPVIRMIGVNRVARFRRIMRHSSNPLVPGSCTSSKTTSGERVVMAARADGPSTAVSTAKPALVRTRCRKSRTGTSSSTTSTV